MDFASCLIESMRGVIQSFVVGISEALSMGSFRYFSVSFMSN